MPNQSDSSNYNTAAQHISCDAHKIDKLMNDTQWEMKCSCQKRGAESESVKPVSLDVISGRDRIFAITMAISVSVNLALMERRIAIVSELSAL